ncbi:MAG: type II toxin-antitoxin system Phd/YefM family antitoxin [Zoogloeaceae bacterium]|jgi:prevent-host-death family protein|nr:type II toxin-antitoxin system Phd/YefM family antitoxin [Zoogloeaceae bacterium]
MLTTTLSSRDFNQHASEAKKRAGKGPVLITDRGRPAHVLLTFADYQRLLGKQRKIADLLAMPGIEALEFDLPPRHDLPRHVDLS